MTHRMLEKYFWDMKAEFTAFIQLSPEERYKMVMKNRSDLIKRVPQH